MRSKNIWENFDTSSYLRNNYSQIHFEDKQIIQILCKFYTDMPQVERGLEIGIGPNLYPVLAALPFINKIDCIDFSLANISYLKKQCIKLDKYWLDFWRLLGSLEKRYRYPLTSEILKNKITIKKGSIYELPKNIYDLSSMHFCAESITSNFNDFSKACNRFIDSAKQGGYIVTSFMENSQGYTVKKIHFPAVPIDERILSTIFQPKTKELKIYKITKAKIALRSGYTGMLMLTARKR